MYMYTVSWIQNRTEIMLDNKKLGEKNPLQHEIP